MTDSEGAEKRRRGVLLSFQGWQRLQSAEQLAAVKQNGGNAFTLEQLSALTGLSPNTLTKVRRRKKPVDFGTLDTYFGAFDLSLEPTDLAAPEVPLPTTAPLTSPHQPPQGALPSDSPFYVYRPPLERLCCQEILRPGALLRIKAPRQFGKTSLVTQILGYAYGQGLRLAVVNLQLVEKRVLESSDAFLRWFCASVAKALGLPNELETRWDSLFGAGYGATNYFESYLLPQGDRPLLLVIDGFDELFSVDGVAADFCGILRAWYEQGRYGGNLDIWQRLRLVITHAMEVWLPLNVHQSPFNVGLPVELPGFDIYQIQEIASRYELDLAEAEAQKLLRLLGGHPYLTQLAMFHLSQGGDMDQLLADAIALDSIFSGHLRRQLHLVEQAPGVAAALATVVQTAAGSKLHPRTAYYLQGLGLVQCQGLEMVPSCELYQRYFATHWEG